MRAMTQCLAGLALLALGPVARGGGLLPVPAWTDAGAAAQAVKHFDLIGEYISMDGKSALQANLLDEEEFLVAVYGGGLPGEGWDGKTVRSKVMQPAALKAALTEYKKIERRSPTLGKAAPADALLVFPDDFTDVEDGIMRAGGRTTKKLGSFRMHIEFMLPLKPGSNPSSQDRGNSGIYIFNIYEVQVLDSFALDLNTTNNAVEIESLNTQWCGALYKKKIPDLNMCYPPLQWQTYDIDFQAPELEGETVISPARITVRHNGVLIHDHVELKTGTGRGATRKPVSEGPILFQGHGNPVLFRNVWATKL